MKNSVLNPLRIGPGDVVRDLRPLEYGKIHTVARISKSAQFNGWLVMTDSVMLNPSRVDLVKRSNGHVA